MEIDKILRLSNGQTFRSIKTFQHHFTTKTANFKMQQQNKINLQYFMRFISL